MSLCLLLPSSHIISTTPDPLDLCPENSTSLALDGV